MPLYPDEENVPRERQRSLRDRIDTLEKDNNLLKERIAEHDEVLQRLYSEIGLPEPLRKDTRY